MNWLLIIFFCISIIHIEHEYSTSTRPSQVKKWFHNMESISSLDRRVDVENSSKNIHK